MKKLTKLLLGTTIPLVTVGATGFGVYSLVNHVNKNKQNHVENFSALSEASKLNQSNASQRYMYGGDITINSLDKESIISAISSNQQQIISSMLSDENFRNVDITLNCTSFENFGFSQNVAQSYNDRTFFEVVISAYVTPKSGFTWSDGTNNQLIVPVTLSKLVYMQKINVISDSYSNVDGNTVVADKVITLNFNGDKDSLEQQMFIDESALLSYIFNDDSRFNSVDFEFGSGIDELNYNDVSGNYEVVSKLWVTPKVLHSWSDGSTSRKEYNLIFNVHRNGDLYRDSLFKLEGRTYYDSTILNPETMSKEDVLNSIYQNKDIIIKTFLQNNTDDVKNVEIEFAPELTNIIVSEHITYPNKTIYQAQTRIAATPINGHSWKDSEDTTPKYCNYVFTFISPVSQEVVNDSFANINYRDTINFETNLINIDSSNPWDYNDLKYKLDDVLYGNIGNQILNSLLTDNSNIFCNVDLEFNGGTWDDIDFNGTSNNGQLMFTAKIEVSVSPKKGHSWSDGSFENKIFILNLSGISVNQI